MNEKSNPDPLRIPRRPGEMIEYQEGSVVSRTLVDKQAGTLTLFAFDKGQGLSEHVSPYDALVLSLDGTAEITVSGKTTRLPEGALILMPAGQPHAIRAIERFKMLLVLVRSS
jgi:quercetin dioxygenase-like cupin family protein